MVDIFNEVEEDLRRDRYLKLWQRYGMWLIAAAVLLVVATGAISVYTNWHANRLAAAGDAFAKAADLEAQGKHKEAADAFAELAADAPGGYPLLARLREASSQLAAGDSKGALATLDAASAGSGDAALRDLAALKAASLVLDTASPDEIAKRLDPLAAEGRPWRHSARELQAAAALKQGRTEDARKILKTLSDDATAPQGLRARAGELLEATGGTAKDAVPPPAAPAAPTPTQ